MLLSEMEDLRGALRQRSEAAEEHHASLAALQERLMNEAKSVAAGEKRCLQYSTSLRNAEANRALRASLLAEKHELISSLQHELGQVTTYIQQKIMHSLQILPLHHVVRGDYCVRRSAFLLAGLFTKPEQAAAETAAARLVEDAVCHLTQKRPYCFLLDKKLRSWKQSAFPREW